MTCEIKAGSGWQDQDPNGLLCKAGKILKNEGLRIVITTGDKNSPTKVYVIGQKHLKHLTTGKIKPWSSPSVDLGLNVYGNGASVTFSNPEDPYYLQVVNLPKETA